MRQQEVSRSRSPARRTKSAVLRTSGLLRLLEVEARKNDAGSIKELKRLLHEHPTQNRLRA
jgi:hypothetical protein